MSIETAIIIAGGRGLRLGPYTEDIPKPMMKVLGKPLLQWILEWLVNEGIKKVVLGVAHRKEKIIEHFKDGSAFGIELTYSHHKLESGTGGAFKLAIKNGKVNDETFLAMNGDELTDIAIKNLVVFHNNQNGIVTVLAAPLRSNFGVLEINNQHTVTSFEEKPLIDTKFVSSGIYIFDQKIYDYLPEEGSLERETFMKLTEENKLKAFRYFGFWQTVNTIKDMEIAENDLKRIRR